MDGYSPDPWSVPRAGVTEVYVYLLSLLGMLRVKKHFYCFLNADIQFFCIDCSCWSNNKRKDHHQDRLMKKVFKSPLFEMFSLLCKFVNKAELSLIELKWKALLLSFSITSLVDKRLILYGCIVDCCTVIQWLGLLPHSMKVLGSNWLAFKRVPVLLESVKVSSLPPCPKTCQLSELETWNSL